MKLRRIISLALAAITLTIIYSGCTSSARLTSVTTHQFKNKIARHKDTQLVDVRTPEEYNESHIANAINIDVNETDFIDKAKTSLKNNKPVYVYCRSGKRSKKAAGILVENGYRVIDLDKGIIGWQNDSLPVTR